MNNEKTCRACLEDQIPMFSLYQPYADIDENMLLNEIIKSMARIEVDLGDGLPDKICKMCLEELKRTFKFITQLQDSDKTLRSVEVLDISVPKPESLLEEYLEDVVHNKNSTDSVKPPNRRNKVDVNGVDKSMNSPKLELDDDADDPPELDSNSDIKLESGDDIFMGEEHGYSKISSNSENQLENMKLYTCVICDTKFKSKRGLNLHKQEMHKFQHKCEHCEKSFPERTHLKVHMRAHFTEDQKPFICGDCGVQFAYKYQLNQHAFKHKDEKPFPCPKCNKGCLTADSLKRHLKVHDKNYEKPKHACKICGREFAYPSFLSEHMKNHTGERPFLCSFCGKGFRQRGALVYHVRSHQNVRPYQCEICKNTFVSQGILKVHMRRHTDERPYVCDICGQGFRQSSDCRMHRRIHLGIKLVECSVCKKRMSSTGQLTIHMRMHTGEKPFSCPECQKRFATRNMVAKHIRTHTGEKPYICSECGKSFSQTSSLNTHMKIHARTKEKDSNEIANTNKIIILKSK